MSSEDEEIKREIQAQISIKEKQISEIEKEISIKEADDKRDLGRNFDQKIVDLESKLNSEKTKLKAISEELTEWTGKKNELTKVVDGLGNDVNKLIIEKYSTLNKKLEEVGLGEQKGIKLKLKKTEAFEDPKKKASIEREINDEFDPKINKIKPQLNSEKLKLDNTSKKVEEVTARKNELNKNIKDLETDFKKLSKGKDSALKSIMKGYKKEKKSQIKQINKEIRRFNKELKLIS